MIFLRARHTRRFGWLCLLAGLTTVAGAARPVQPPTAEAKLAASMVLGQHDWEAQARRCPVDVMPASFPPREPGQACDPGEYATCLLQCSAGTTMACYWLAQALLDSEPKAAEVLFQRACALGEASGCTNHAAGISVDEPDDAPVQACAAKTFARTCAAHDPWGCTMSAIHFASGSGVARDPAAALKALAGSCTNGSDDPACRAGMALQQTLTGGASTKPASPPRSAPEPTR